MKSYMALPLVFNCLAIIAGIGVGLMNLSSGHIGFAIGDFSGAGLAACCLVAITVLIVRKP